MQTNNQLEKELMAERFKYDMQLKQMEVDARKQKEKEIEDRKDERVRITGTQQSKMIDQRQNGLLPSDFESNVPENLGGAEQPLPPPPGMQQGDAPVELEAQ
jgi:hypothetical protein